MDVLQDIAHEPHQDRVLMLKLTDAFNFPHMLLAPINDQTFFACPQDIADEVDGENVLIVTHGDAVNSSGTRLMPWTIVYPVLHTGFTVAYRDQHQGMLRPAKLGIAVNTHHCYCWTIVYPVLHTGFTVAYRDQHQGMLRHAKLGIAVNTHHCYGFTIVLIIAIIVLCQLACTAVNT